MEHMSTTYHRVNQKTDTTDKKPGLTARLSNALVPIDSRDSGRRKLLNENSRRRSMLKVERSKHLARLCSTTSTDSWRWEVIGIFVCIATLASIFGILLAYDQKPLPHSVAGVSLNTAISILATVSRATTISVAAQIIAQQKWVRFVSAVQPLSIAELYDDATRGPLGSFFLLWSRPRSMLAVAVASITVLALGFEPFVQQSLSFPSKESLTTRTLPAIWTTTNISYSDTDAASNKTVAFNALLLQALYAESIAPLQPTCAASTCHWPRYTSAAMCSHCVDAIHQTIVSSNDSNALTAYAIGNFLDDFDDMVDLSAENATYTYSVQTNYSISVGEGPPFVFTANFTGNADEVIVSGSLDFLQNMVWNVADPPAMQAGHGIPWFPNTTGPLTSLAHVRLNISEDGLSLEPKSASICTINLCAQEQISSSINGTFSTNVTNRMWGNYSSAMYYNGVFYTWVAETSSVNFTAVDAELVARLNTLIIGLEDTSAVNLNPRFFTSYGPSDVPLYQSADTITNPSPNTLKFIDDTANSSAKIAQVFSNYFDQSGDLRITGEAYETVPFVNVRWAWLCFPIIVVLMCAITLFVTIYQSHRIGLPTWTTSPFPLLFGYHHRDRELNVASAMNPSISYDDSIDDREAAEEFQVKDVSTAATLNGTASAQYAEWASKARVRLIRRDKHWLFEDDT